MAIKLVVVHKFEKYVRGAEITDQKEIDRVLAGHHEPRVVKVSVPDAAPLPAPAPAKAIGPKTAA
jgi:hypothetical protein